MRKVVCLHCGQDWIRKYRRNDNGQVFYLCPECESVWLDAGEPDKETEFYLSEFLSLERPGEERNVITALD